MFAGEDDLRQVYNEVSSLKAKYYELGIALGLPAGELDAVKSANHHNIDHALTQVLLLWLRGKSAASETQPPTWQSLVRAVDSRTCGNHMLAMTIASRHSVSGKLIETAHYNHKLICNYF